ncbi:MAG: hypothetical protein BWY70_01751 [Bacteroidetes bacterium ADurb.Bin408]|nr:MAG: hypothetical protein BWY70_01751 [Bacteroidetes bacterium ADurb.Bin408]
MYDASKVIEWVISVATNLYQISCEALAAHDGAAVLNVEPLKVAVVYEQLLLGVNVTAPEQLLLAGWAFMLKIPRKKTDDKIINLIINFAFINIYNSFNLYFLTSIQN